MKSILLLNKKSNSVPNFKTGTFLPKILFAWVLLITTSSLYSQETAIWTGAVSSDWCNAANWAGGKVPDEATNTVIPAGGKNMPVVSCMFTFNAGTANIDVQEGATLTIPSSRALNITGSFVSHDANRYVLAGRINFSGANQEIPGFIYNNLTVSGAGVKTVVGNAQVNGSLILTNGIIKTTSKNQITLGTNGRVTAGYENSYIDGPFTRLTNSSRTYNFPIGANGVVKTVLISPELENEGSFTVYYRHSATPDNGVFNSTNLIANNDAGYWEISRGGNASNALVQVDYQNTNSARDWSNRRLPIETSNVALIQNIQHAWSYNGDASKGLQHIESIPFEAGGQLGTTLQTNYSRITFGYGFAEILPIRLINFIGTYQNNAAEINFSLDQGKDIVNTELQHSLDEKHFEKLTSVQAGNATVFNYSHNTTKSGVHFYRLLMKDKANNISYSKTIEVIVPDFITSIKGLKATLVRYEAAVKLESAKRQPIGINIFDMAGHLVSKQIVTAQAGDNLLSVNTMMVTPGIYNMYVQTADGAKASLRFMKE